MASANPIKFHEVCIVSPNDPNDSPSEYSLPLTFLDIFWLPLDPASRVFFYEFPEPNADFSNIFLPKLKSSLSVTLQHYLPVAGCLTWPQESETPVIQYKTGDGVSVTIAQTNSDFYSLSGNEFRDSTELRSLLPDFPSSETQAPVMTLQITLFPDVGFSIGYVAHHGIMDGKSVSLFMNSWAHICKTGDVLPPALTPSFDRSFVDQQSELKRLYPMTFGKPRDPENRSLTIFDTTCPPDIKLGTVRLMREDIDVLKKLVCGYRKEKKNQDNGPRLSTFIVSSAYAYVCLVKAKKLMTKEAVIGINVDARGRLEPPVSSSYFGNCVVGCAGFGYTKDLLSEDGFCIAVDAVTEGLSWLNGGVLKVAEKLNSLVEGMKRDGPRDAKGFAIAGSPRFELYKTDFGWGRPRKVEMISIAKTGAFYISDDRDGNGGIEIGVGLNKHEAEEFNSVFASGLKF